MDDLCGRDPPVGGPPLDRVPLHRQPEQHGGGAPPVCDDFKRAVLASPSGAELEALVAAVFAVLLAIVGAWSSRRVPWLTGSRRALRAFAFTVLPFVVAEVGTVVLSLLTGLLAIPPLLGAGTAVDIGILAVGVTVSMYRVARRKPTSPI